MHEAEGQVSDVDVKDRFKVQGTKDQVSDIGCQRSA